MYFVLMGPVRVCVVDVSQMGGVRWHCGGRTLKDGGEAVRRNADGWSIGPIVRLRLDHLNVLEEGRGELGFERVEERGRIRYVVLGIDTVVLNTAKGHVEGRRIVGSGISHGRVLRGDGVLAGLRRVCGFGWQGKARGQSEIRKNVWWCRKWAIPIEVVKFFLERLGISLRRGCRARQIRLDTFGEKRQPEIIEHGILLRLGDKK